jgi:adenine-specific DNA-methyltransferase
MLAAIDLLRIEATKKLDQSKRGQLGQFMTPMSIANFMASLFAHRKNEHVSILDAGAGIGALSLALLEQIKGWNGIGEVGITAYEIDKVLLNYLNENINECSKVFRAKDLKFKSNIVNSDFISDATFKVNWGQTEFTHAILNPPYKKIHSDSEHRKLLSSIGFETVNLYSAFVALAIMLLKDNGELVAIIPRSFCNGNYYKPFRKQILANTAIRQIHLFESRNHAFKDDEVLQENIIIHLVKKAKQGNVIVTTSKDADFGDTTKEIYSFDQIVKRTDREYFIHIPHSDDQIQNSTKIRYSLSDIGLEVSTGPVVDFRARDYIYMEPQHNTVPLLYPMHFNCKEIEWPKQGKKPNAIVLNDETLKMFYPSGFYTIVKRFSSKEEKQRIVARVLNPERLAAEHIGLENHLNVFHAKKKGIDSNLAYGLAAYLNSSYVDCYFRSFNGHTQVNATDLRQMKYPQREVLIALGVWARELESFEQSVIDGRIKEIL